jgi:hypothetical protein
MEDGQFSKKVIIKVSDFRSASIQGKYLAKKGIWVSEFRIESGLNCGGHAFAYRRLFVRPDIGGIQSKKDELVATVFELYKNSLSCKRKERRGSQPQLKISVQGGIWHLGRNC